MEQETMVIVEPNYITRFVLNVISLLHN